MTRPTQMTGRTVGNWTLEDSISEGGMGAVYRARHVTLDKSAAVKVMRPEFTDEESFRERFRREAATQARLEHPHIARVHDYMEQDGCWFLVMELVEGGSLADELARRGGPVPVEQALDWTREALEGLAYAHSEGVIHRDVKPMNLLLNRHGQVVVADFGIAKEASLPQLTSTGHTVGTPQYMSPEQVQRPADVDLRSDLYSMGVVLYELLTGHKPFDGESGFQVALAHVQTPPPDMSRWNPSIPSAVVQLVARAMAKNPDERYQTAQGFLAALEAVRDERSPPLPPQAATSSPPVATTVLNTPPRSGTVRMDSSAFGPPPPGAAPPGTSAPQSASPKSRTLLAAVVVAACFAVAVTAGVFPLKFGAKAQTLEDVVRHARMAGEAADEAKTKAARAKDLADEALAAAEKAEDASGVADQMKHLAAGRAVLETARTFLGEAEDAEAELLDRSAKSRAAADAIDLDLAEPLPSAEAAPATVPRSDSPEATEAGRRAVSFADRVTKEAQDQVREAREAIESADDRLESIEATLDDPAKAAATAKERIKRAEEELKQKKKEMEEEAKRREEEALRERQKLIDQLNPEGGPLPDQPVVAVLAHGDPLFVGPFEMELERRLRRSRLDVRDEHNSIEISEQLGGVSRPSATELSESLREQGFHVLVLVTLDEGARRTQSFRRLQGNAVAGRLRINAHLLNTGKPIGRGWSEAVEYTDGSAAAKAQRSLIGATPELVEAIRTDWRRFLATYEELAE